MKTAKSFTLAWFFYAVGSLAYWILSVNQYSQSWVEFWMPAYTRSMRRSLAQQNAAEGCSSRWPFDGMGTGPWPWS